MTEFERYLHIRCAELGITVPENTTKEQLEAELAAYSKDAVAVLTEDGCGVDWRQTDKPTVEYVVEFTAGGNYIFKAESEAAARKWTNAELASNLSSFGKEIIDWEVGKIYEEEHEG